MPRDIQPGAYVRARGGMYAGATGRVVSISQSASGPYASVDVGETHPIAVFVSGLELVGTESHSAIVGTRSPALALARAERDELLAIIHRDGGHYVGEHGVTKAVADAHATWAAVVSERDRLRREVEALRGELAALRPHVHDDIVGHIDAILRGES